LTLRIGKDFFIYRKTVVKTTWKLRLLMLALFFVVFVIPYRFWLSALAQTLVLSDQIQKSDAIFVENWNVPDLNALVAAAQLHRTGYAPSVLIARFIQTDRLSLGGIELPKDYEQVLRLYCQDAGLDLNNVETIPVEAIDPITLNMARQVSTMLHGKGVTSVILVTSFYHSRRSALTYRKFLKPLGIKLASYPVTQRFTPGNWWKTKDGINTVLMELIKLQYYRFFVL
jgi:uncharacterized SAM-binding protein YcdF (DUF218 family)